MGTMQRVTLGLTATGIASFGLAALCFVLGEEPAKAAKPEGGARAISEKSEGVELLDVSAVVADVVVELTDGATIDAKLESRNDEALPADTRLVAEQKGSTLYIRVEDDEDDGFSLKRLFRDSAEPRLTVRLPRALKPELRLSTVSGDVDLPELTLKEGHVKSVSGDIAAVCLKADASLSIESVSGDLRVDRCLEASTVRVRSTSGDIAVDGLKGVVEAQTVSGDVSIEVVGRANVRTTSGDIAMKLQPDAGESQGHSVSGDIHVSLPTDAATTLDMKSISGSLNAGSSESDSGRLVMDVKDSKSKLTLGTTSGDVHVSRM